MNGPIKSDSEKPSTPFDWMECGIVVAGVLVVGGLLMESWPELNMAISECRFPNIVVTGGIIVTVGVLIEVVLGIFITQRANRAQANANERVAKAEKDTAEANLKLEELRKKVADRRLNSEQSSRLTAFLSQFSGQVVNVMEHGTSVEAMAFSRDIRNILDGAGWKINPAGTMITSSLEHRGVFVLVTPEDGNLPAASALASAINHEGFDVTYSYDGGISPTPTTRGVILLFVASKS